MLGVSVGPCVTVIVELGAGVWVGVSVVVGVHVHVGVSVNVGTSDGVNVTDGVSEGSPGIKVGAATATCALSAGPKSRIMTNRIHRPESNRNVMLIRS